MDIADDPCERKRSNTDPPKERSESDAAEVPLAGLWPDTSIEAVEVQSAISIPTDLLHKNNIYVLQVQGDCMIGDHILDGDCLIVEKRNSAKDGEMVLTLTENSEATLRRFHRDGGKVRLEQTDTSGDAMVFDENDVVIRGIVVGILRKYRG
ncbi:MAG TPA: S24 family peptidase [Desulfomonilaceae bacterium]|nr:S24 family peptidase [Desulfomonilaceae bacterium]